MPAHQSGGEAALYKAHQPGMEDGGRHDMTAIQPHRAARQSGEQHTRTQENATRAKENSEYVRRLLQARQPEFASALESAVRKLARDHAEVGTAACS
jgi:hypothetical protein